VDKEKDRHMLKKHSSRPRHTTLICWLYGPAILLLLMAVIASHYLDIPFSRFTRDPLAIAKEHPFVGILSNIGTILWSFSTAICFFSYMLLRTRKESRNVLQFIMLGALISLALLLDDLFMVHETISPQYFGVSEKTVLLSHGLLLIFYLTWFRKTIIQTDYTLLLLAASLFAISLLIDRLLESVLPCRHLFEDGAKFLGIVSWFGYHLSTCLRQLRPHYPHTPHQNPAS